VAGERSQATVFPSEDNIFRAFNVTARTAVKAVIVGQDPYHDDGQADGLAFSVRNGLSIPRSLRNIFKELSDDTGAVSPVSGDLTKWGEQGVLMLNSVLTVRAHTPGSHQGRGWERITDEILRSLSMDDHPIAFILWGKYAQQKRGLIDQTKHCVIESVHPSPFSARNGFFGSRPFSKVNTFMYDHGIDPIDWQLAHD
jgi:uracil-DNA glycosylase